MAVPEHYIDRMMQTTERTYSAISGCEEELRLLDLADSATPRDIREAAEQAIMNLKETDGDDDLEEEATVTDGSPSETADGIDSESIARIEQARDRLLAAPRVEKTAPVPVLANSALYKLAGNSICANVLLHIYEEALYPTGRRLSTEQPSLFDLPCSGWSATGGASPSD
jgi:hypothetical protein